MTFFLNILFIVYRGDSLTLGVYYIAFEFSNGLRRAFVRISMGGFWEGTCTYLTSTHSRRVATVYL